MKHTCSALHQSSLQLSFSACVNKQVASGRNSKTHSFWAGRISPRAGELPKLPLPNSPNTARLRRLRREVNKLEVVNINNGVNPLFIHCFTRFFIYFLFLSDEGPTLETSDFTICVGSAPTFLCFDLHLYTPYAAHYVYFTLYI